MSDRAFIDTNVLVYAFDRDEPVKRAKARTLIESVPPDALVLSAQVLGEFFWVTTRRLRTPLSPDKARDAIAFLRAIEVVPIDGELVARAIERSVSSHFAYWDALIVESALAAGCDTLLTEDLAAGARHDGLTVVDPFA